MSKKKGTPKGSRNCAVYAISMLRVHRRMMGVMGMKWFTVLAKAPTTMIATRIMRGTLQICLNRSQFFSRRYPSQVSLQSVFRIPILFSSGW